MADLLSKFISDKNSICREERQYALYLYNVLQAYHFGSRNDDVVKIMNDIFGKELNENENGKLEIDNVFYEATFMRDLHEYNRRCFYLANDRISEDNENLYLYKNPSVGEYGKTSKDQNKDLAKSFNWKLFSYLKANRDKLYNSDVLELNKEQKEALTKKKLDAYFSETESMLDFTKTDGEAFCVEYHLGQSKDFNVGDNIVKQDMRSMMNAKPDIAVIYHYTKDTEKKYLLFLECKFESAETKDGIRMQTCIQYMIADFLCSEWVDNGNGGKEKLKINDLKFGCDISSLMEKLGQSVKVVFYRNFNDNEITDTSHVCIDIEKLIQINMNKEIFGVKND